MSYIESVGVCHGRVQEILSNFLIRKILGHNIFCCVNVLQNLVNTTILFDEFQSTLRTNAADLVCIIASQQDTEIDELDVSSCNFRYTPQNDSIQARQELSQG